MFKIIFFISSFLLLISFSSFSQNGQTINGRFYGQGSLNPTRSTYVSPDYESKKQLVSELEIRYEKNRNEYLSFVETALKLLTNDKNSDLYARQVKALNNYIETFKETERNKSWSMAGPLLGTARVKYYSDLNGL